DVRQHRIRQRTMSRSNAKKVAKQLEHVRRILRQWDPIGVIPSPEFRRSHRRIRFLCTRSAEKASNRCRRRWAVPSSFAAGYRKYGPERQSNAAPAFCGRTVEMVVQSK